jgi:hypothetical protein
MVSPIVVIVMVWLVCADYTGDRLSIGFQCMAATQMKTMTEAGRSPAMFDAGLALHRESSNYCSVVPWKFPDLTRTAPLQ